MIFGDAPEQGFVRGRRFIHPVIGFEFEVPPRFRLLNAERSVTGFGPDGARMHFDLQPIASGRSLGRYLHDTWAPRVRITHFERFTVNGMDAVTALARGSGGRGGRLVAIRFRRDAVARFLFAPSAPPGSGLDRRYRTATHSFRRLRAWEAQSVQPWRIAVPRGRSRRHREEPRRPPLRGGGGDAPPDVPAAERPAAGRASDRRSRQADRGGRRGRRSLLSGSHGPACGESDAARGSPGARPEVPGERESGTRRRTDHLLLTRRTREIDKPPRRNETPRRRLQAPRS